MTEQKTINYKEVIKSDKLNQFLDNLIHTSGLTEGLIELLEEINLDIEDKNGKKLKINIPIEDIKERLKNQGL